MKRSRHIFVWIGITMLSGMFLIGQQAWQPYCEDNSNCPAGKFCERDLDCAGKGVCLPIPSGCPDEWNPVCGCDGVTYSNVCFAHAAGVSVEYTGECLCDENADCAEGEYCEKPVGLCDGEGTCVDQPLCKCPEYFDPQCGCDGNTYGNECEAACRGVSISYPGPCLCTESSECTPEQFCYKEPGECKEQGACMNRPTHCDPAIWAPVCACNGITYGNQNCAFFDGESVAYEGSCTSDSICREDGDCKETDFCKKPLGFCDLAPFGYCSLRQENCLHYWMPVCGCDGNTYGNECNADSVGVSVDYRGECVKPEP